MLSIKTSLSPSPENAQKMDTDRLKKACMDFESIFINEMLKGADNSLGGEQGFLKGNDGKIVKSMFNERMADSMTSGGGMGLGEILFERLNV